MPGWPQNQVRFNGVTIAPAVPAGRGSAEHLRGARRALITSFFWAPLSAPLLGARQIFWPPAGRCGLPSFIKTPLGPLRAPLTSALLNAERAPFVQNLVSVQIVRLDIPLFGQDNIKKKKEQWGRLPG